MTLLVNWNTGTAPNNNTNISEPAFLLVLGLGL
jgi:hypothetical protein